MKVRLIEFQEWLAKNGRDGTTLTVVEKSDLQKAWRAELRERATSTIASSAKPIFVAKGNFPTAIGEDGKLSLPRVDALFSELDKMTRYERTVFLERFLQRWEEWDRIRLVAVSGLAVGSGGRKAGKLKQAASDAQRAKIVGEFKRIRAGNHELTKTAIRKRIERAKIGSYKTIVAATKNLV